MTEHTVIDLTALVPMFRCLHCGAEQELELPISLQEAARLSEQWIKEHADCDAPMEETWTSHPSLTAEERNRSLR